MDQNAHARRPNYHRGRRGPDRRGSDRRPQQPQQPPPDQGGREQRDHVDVEQIMREIRARISKGSGIDLTNQQIQELAARRLEAILDPRTVKPALLDQLRRGAAAVDLPSAQPATSLVFEEGTLYSSPSGFVRFVRRLLKPFLGPLINPAPVADALNTQVTINTEAAVREAARDRRQAEWNALHYELLQRMVTDTSRVSIEMQSLALRVESLAARVDFNERRVRGLENKAHQARPAGRSHESAVAQVTIPREPVTVPTPMVTVTPEVPRTAPQGAGDLPSDGTKKRRRRRRGRRSGGGQPAAGFAAVAGDTSPSGTELGAQDSPDSEDTGELDGEWEGDEPASSPGGGGQAGDDDTPMSVAPDEVAREAVERSPVEVVDVAEAPEPLVSETVTPEPVVSEPVGSEPVVSESVVSEPVTVQPEPLTAQPAAVAAQPMPPRDEAVPTPEVTPPIEPPDPGPSDR